MNDQATILYYEMDYLSGKAKQKKAVSYKLNLKELKREQIKQARKTKKKMKLNFYEEY